MVFFHPSRDVHQAAWDPCSYRWIIWSKWEIELCVISIEVVGEAMCLYDGSQWCSVCGEEEGSKNRSLGNSSDQFMCFGYLPAPGHPERPTSEIGFKPAKWNPNDIQWWEGGQEDLMYDLLSLHILKEKSKKCLPIKWKSWVPINFHWMDKKVEIFSLSSYINYAFRWTILLIAEHHHYYYYYYYYY